MCIAGKRALYLIAVATIAGIVSLVIVISYNYYANLNNDDNYLNKPGPWHVKPIYPVAKIVYGDNNGDNNSNTTSIEGTPVWQVANSTISAYDDCGSTGICTSESIGQNNTLAEVKMYYGTAANNGDDIIAVSIKNTGTAKFNLVGLFIDGEPPAAPYEGGPLHAAIVKTKYIEKYPFWNKELIQQSEASPIKEPFVLNPDESLYGYIRGKWIVEAPDEPISNNKPITKFMVGAEYVYDIDDISAIGSPTDKPKNDWIISTKYEIPSGETLISHATDMR